MSQSDGERELVLGSKQLLSLFFVVVALFGVFFALGYMIGHNSTKPLAGLETPGAPAATAGTANTEVSRSADSEPPRETASTDPTPTTTPAAPSGDAPNDATPSPAPPPPPSSGPPVTTPAPTASVREATAVPQAGATYLQVTALHRADADNLAKTLREQSLPVLIAASSRPDLFRVLVGPYHQVADVADAKEKLKSLGFANAFVQK
jgi:cell division septation protein DedD